MKKEKEKNRNHCSLSLSLTDIPKWDQCERQQCEKHKEKRKKRKGEEGVCFFTLTAQNPIRLWVCLGLRLGITLFSIRMLHWRTYTLPNYSLCISHGFRLPLTSPFCFFSFVPSESLCDYFCKFLFFLIIFFYDTVSLSASDFWICVGIFAGSARQCLWNEDHPGWPSTGIEEVAVDLDSLLPFSFSSRCFLPLWFSLSTVAFTPPWVSFWGFFLNFFVFVFCFVFVFYTTSLVIISHKNMCKICRSPFGFAKVLVWAFLTLSP